MDVTTLLDELDTALTAGVTNVTVFDTVPSRINPPAAVFTTGEGRYDETFENSMRVNVQCLVLTSRSNDRAGQDKLHTFLDPTHADSVKTAVEAGTYTQDVSAVVTGWDAPATLDVAGTSYFVVAFQIEAID